MKIVWLILLLTYLLGSLAIADTLSAKHLRRWLQRQYNYKVKESRQLSRMDLPYLQTAFRQSLVRAEDLRNYLGTLTNTELSANLTKAAIEILKKPQQTEEEGLLFQTILESAIVLSSHRVPNVISLPASFWKNFKRVRSIQHEILYAKCMGSICLTVFAVTAFTLWNSLRFTDPLAGLFSIPNWLVLISSAFGANAAFVVFGKETFDFLSYLVWYNPEFKKTVGTIATAIPGTPWLPSRRVTWLFDKYHQVSERTLRNPPTEDQTACLRSLFVLSP